MKKIMDKMAFAVGLPGEAIPGQPLIEILGQNRIIIENHKGVVRYEKEEICVRVHCGQILIKGRNLQLMKMCKPQLVIRGRVECVQLLYGGVGK